MFLYLLWFLVVVGGRQRGDQGSETFCFYDRLTEFADLDCRFYMLFESVDMQHRNNLSDIFSIPNTSLFQSACFYGGFWGLLLGELEVMGF